MLTSLCAPTHTHTYTHTHTHTGLDCASDTDAYEYILMCAPPHTYTLTHTRTHTQGWIDLAVLASMLITVIQKATSYVGVSALVTPPPPVPSQLCKYTHVYTCVYVIYVYIYVYNLKTCK